METATRGWIDGRRRVAGEDDALAGTLDVGVGRRDRAYEGAGVGVARAFDDVGGTAEFDDFPEVHDGDAVGNVFYDREVVGDEHEAEVHFAHELREEVEDLRLDGHVEGGDGFVGDDDLRLEGERAGDGDALALATGEFMRIFLHETRGEADGAHEGSDAGVDVGGAAHAVDEERLGECIENSHTRVQRSVGVLEDHLEIATRGEDVGGVTGGEILAGENHGAAGGGDELENGAGEGGFAAAGFADEAEDFATGDAESDAVDGFDGADVAFEEEA